MKFLYRNEKITNQVLKFRWVKDTSYLPYSPSAKEAELICLLFCFQEPIKPLEKRALNFLVNEFLLKNNYKLTSITFSDENDDQVKLLF